MNEALPDKVFRSDAPRTALEQEEPRGPRVAWTVRLLGAVEADNGQQVIAHFSTRTVAQLLARLALEPDRAHPREELIELLWPGVALSTGRNRLRQTLSTLKSLLEKQHGPGTPVIEADRMSVRTVPGAIDCDVRILERLVRAERPDSARAMLRGEFMPGHFEDWAVEERHRVQALHDKLNQRASQPAPEVVPSGVPSYWTPGFGLEPTVLELAESVRRHRLVSLFGAGGCGKTRLSAALAARLSRETPEASAATPLPVFDRIAFVSLVDCVHPQDLHRALVSSLNVLPGSDPVVGIVNSLAGRTSLLILDNCEQLDNESTALFEHLLRELPGLHLLLTSRRRFDLDGEFCFALNGLSVPAPGTSIDALRRNDAIALFLSRAHNAAPNNAFELPEVAELVHHLHGMPLAIELAAARMRFLSPAQLLHRLREPTGSPMLDQLARPALGDTVAHRHASMRQVIASTWSQLELAQVSVMQALAVLSSPAPVNAVAAAAAIPPAQAQDALDQLRDRHLLQVPNVDGVQRYSLLQALREYATEQLGAAAAQQARSRIRQWLIRQGHAVPHPEMATAGLEGGLIRTAIETAHADLADTEGVELALCFRPLWDAEPLPAATLESIELMLAQITDATVQGDAHALLAYGHGVLGQMQRGLEHAKTALSLARDDCRRADAHCSLLSLSYFSNGFYNGLERDLSAAEALARQHGNVRATAAAMRLRAVIATNVHQDFELAEQCLAQAQQLCEQLGSRRQSNSRLLERAVLWWGLGRREEALEMLQACERTSVELKDWNTHAAVYWYRARFFIQQRRWQDALEANQESVRIGWRHHLTHHLPMVLLHLPEILVMRGRPEDAALLLGFAMHHSLRLRGAINVIEAREIKSGRRMIRLHLGAAQAESLRVEGATMGLAKAVTLALSAPSLATTAEN